MPNYKGWARSGIWKYGNAELHFDGNSLWLIHFDDTFGKPRGGQGLRIISSGVRERMSLVALERALKNGGVRYRITADRAKNPGCVEVVTEGNVCFLVKAKGPRRELGLQLFGCSQLDINRRHYEIE